MITNKLVLGRIISAAVAVYKTADALPSSDPLVQRMKNATLQTTEDFVVLFCHAKNEKDKQSVESSLEILCGYFALASEQNWIHEQNFSALTKEYRDLYTQLSAVEVRLPHNSQQGETEQNRNIVKATLKKDPVRTISSININDRQEKILAYMKKNPESQFGPVAGLFDGISNRTVRRDLDVLVKSKLLVREGNTSSSLYRLI